MADRRGMASRVFLTLAQHRINIEFISHIVDDEGKGRMTFCVERKNLEDVVSLLHQNREQIGHGRLLHDRNVGTVSVFGPHFREKFGVAGTFFTAIGSADINILAISTSVSTVSCLVAETDMPAAVAALSKAFDLPGT